MVRPTGILVAEGKSHFLRHANHGHALLGERDRRVEHFRYCFRTQGGGEARQPPGNASPQPSGPARGFRLASVDPRSAHLRSPVPPQ